MDLRSANSSEQQRVSRATVGKTVRGLRRGRNLTQANLAVQLGLSQARLSEIERGGGSFTAEQFLQILRLFNVAVAVFDPRGARDQHAELQNALARLGATELRENEQVLPSAQVDTVNRALREALVVGTPRLLSALGPVLVRNVDRVNLRGLYLELARIGLERRLAWLVESIRDAVREQTSPATPPAWTKRYRRALVVLDAFLGSIATADPQGIAPDVLDADIRSKQSLERVQAAASVVATRWGIVTSLQALDFSTVLKAARAGD